MRRHKKKLLFSITSLIAAAILLVIFLVSSVIHSLPSLNLLENRQVAQSTKIYDRTGQFPLYELYGEEKRTSIPFSSIPERVKQATISIEDENFYNHLAFDWRGLARAALANLTSGWGTQGGSTITQQLARNAFLTREKTITRKIKELILALELEKKFTKDEIFGLYLNQIPYGGNAYGIEAASQTYFQKTVADLSLAEAALLASLPQSPSYLSPWGTHLKDLLDRKNLTLRKMHDLGYITSGEMETASKEILTFAKQAATITAPHFVLTVVDYLNNKYGEDFVRQAGLRVVTTLDLEMQKLAEQVVKEGAERNERLYEGKNAALVAQDATTGQILALVGSRDYFDKELEGNFNVATQGLRQPGSALKPFVYLTAFKKGYPPGTILFDLKTEFDATEIPENSYQPENFDEIFRGPISMEQALAQSINIPAVKTLFLAGVDDFLKLIKSFGIKTLTERGRYGLSLTLGGGEVKLVELVGAYSVLAQEGVRHDQSIILEIRDKNNEVLEEYKDYAERVIDPQYPRLINAILSEAELRAPLFKNSLDLTIFPGYDVAMKTGTSNDYRDAWTVAYSPTIVVGVWAGNNDNQAMQRHGGSILAAVPIMSAFMRDALKSQPAEVFNQPEPVVVDKPVLNGDYLITYQDNGQESKQLHDILFYVNRKDPLGPRPLNPEADSQFENWEKPVLEWAKTNVPGFLENSTYNRPLSDSAILNTVVGGSQKSSSKITLFSPRAGIFIDNALFINAKIDSPQAITKIEISFNGQIIDQQAWAFGYSPSYQRTLYPWIVNPQNVLKISATEADGNILSSEVILYH